MKNFLSKTFEELNKGWIGVDLDGTLAKYDKWRGIDHVGDPIPEMIKKVKKALDDGIIIKIFTARVSSDDFEPKGREAIEKFCKDNFGLVLPITNVKDNSCIEIWDDRAKQVIKNTGEFRESFDIHMKKFESEEPTEAQIKAGNYKKYHMKMNGIKITIENPAGSYRSGKDDDGNEWRTKMNHHYGYIKGTVGAD